MELFDKKFVHFMWDDELEGKKVFVSDSIDSLIDYIEKDTVTYKVHCSRNIKLPFERDDAVCYRFAYYDPNYGAKKAFYKEGKTVQYLYGDNTWHDCMGTPYWSADCEYRAKPEEEKWIVYLNRVTKIYGKGGSLTACLEDKWEDVQKECGAKTKLFVGTKVEAAAWYKSRQKFAEVIKDWEDGKRIQYLDESTKTWMDIPKDYTIVWFTDREYRAESKRMTYRQLAEWLAKGNGEHTTTLAEDAVTSIKYYKTSVDKEVLDVCKIRRWGSDEWIEPTVDVYLEDCE